jgi:hypothetical protein
MRWLEFYVDRPAKSGCYGFMLCIGKLHLSVTWPAEDTKGGRDGRADS